MMAFNAPVGAPQGPAPAPSAPGSTAALTAALKPASAKVPLDSYQASPARVAEPALRGRLSLEAAGQNPSRLESAVESLVTKVKRICARLKEIASRDPLFVNDTPFGSPRLPQRPLGIEVPKVLDKDPILKGIDSGTQPWLC